MARTSERETSVLSLALLPVFDLSEGDTFSIHDHECSKLFRVVRVLDEDHVEIERLYH